MFLVVTISPLDDKWEERDREMTSVAGRPPFFSGATCVGCVRTRDHEWKIETFAEAEKVKKRLEEIEGVEVYIREQ